MTFWGSVLTGAVSGAVGGTVGGAVTGGILGGSAGALQGAMMGAAFGAAGGAVMGGLGGSSWTNFAKDVARNSMMIGGGAYSAATGNLDMFAGGLVGGGLGYKFATNKNPSLWSSTSSPSSDSNKAGRTVDVKIESVETNELATVKPNGEGFDINRVAKAIGATAGVAEEYYKQAGSLKMAKALVVVGGVAEVIDAVRLSNELSCYGIPRIQAALVHVTGIMATSVATGVGFGVGLSFAGPVGGIAGGAMGYAVATRYYGQYESAALEYYGCR